MMSVPHWAWGVLVVARPMLFVVLDTQLKAMALVQATAYSFMVLVNCFL
jgi:hypothetical protein